MNSKIRNLLIIIIGISMMILGVQLSKPTPKSEVTVIQESWSKVDSKSYARDKLYEWTDKQWSCLTNLWGKESAWNPNAYNKIKVQGRNAGGIPQLLGLDPDTPAPEQIERGLSYIYYRYDTPCNAWVHFKKKGWH